MFLGRLINILSAKACRSAKQDELRGCCKTEQEAALLGAEHVNLTVICHLLAITPSYAGFFFYFSSVLLFFFPCLFFLFSFFFSSNSSRLHWVSKCSKLISRTCFIGDLPQHEEGNNGLELKNQFRAWQNGSFSSSRICVGVSLCVGSQLCGGDGPWVHTGGQLAVPHRHLEHMWWHFWCSEAGQGRNTSKPLSGEQRWSAKITELQNPELKEPTRIKSSS